VNEHVSIPISGDWAYRRSGCQPKLDDTSEASNWSGHRLGLPQVPREMDTCMRPIFVAVNLFTFRTGGTTAVWLRVPWVSVVSVAVYG